MTVRLLWFVAISVFNTFEKKIKCALCTIIRLKLEYHIHEHKYYLYIPTHKTRKCVGIKWFLIQRIKKIQLYT